MKKTTLTTTSILALTALLYTGCASSSSKMQESWNKQHIESKSPVRLVQDPSFKNGTRYIEDWAGVKGTSAINKEYQEKSFQQIQQSCGYGKNEFIEARIVNHTQTSWEEVWLFNDPKSYRDDKISGITLYLQYNPNSNQTSVKFIGVCHTPKGTSFTNID